MGAMEAVQMVCSALLNPRICPIRAQTPCTLCPLTIPQRCSAALRSAMARVRGVRGRGCCSVQGPDGVEGALGRPQGVCVGRYGRRGARARFRELIHIVVLVRDFGHSCPHGDALATIDRINIH